MHPATAILLGAVLQDVPPVADPSAAPEPTPAKITLTTGEVLEGRIVEETPGGYRVQHPVLGEVMLERDDVAGVETPSTEPEPPKSPWTGSLSFAISGYENVNSNLELRVAGELKQKTYLDELTLSARYFFGVTNSETQNNNFQTTIDYTRDLADPKWFLFGTGQYEYDEFQSWEHRLSGWGGAGYRFVKDETLDLTGRLGFGTSYEFGPPSRLIPEALLGLEFEWRISDAQKLKGFFTYYPDVDEIGEFRFNTGLTWNLKIDGWEGVSFEAGINDQYQSQITSGTRNDLRYFAGLKYEF